MVASSSFYRGRGPLVSVLLPSRGNPDGMKLSILSLQKSTIDPSLIEYLVRVDNDDLQSIEQALYLRKTVPSGGFGIVVGHSEGYYGIHNYVNELARKAEGDWLLLLNDDVEIFDSEMWDQKLLGISLPEPAPIGASDVFYLGTFEEGNDKSCLRTSALFLIRRKSFEIMGHVSLSPFCDTWIERVFSNVVFPFYSAPLKFRQGIKKNLRNPEEDKKVMQKMLFPLTTKKGILADSQKLMDYLCNLEVQDKS